MDVHAVIPLKDLSQGKARLSGALDAARRTALIEIMLEHVASVLTRTPGITQVYVLTSKNIRLSIEYNYIFDLNLDLDAAVALAADELRARGARGMLLAVHADLPFITTEETGALVAACERDALVVAPDAAGTGTNALAFPLSSAVRSRYGPGSFDAHAEVARATHLPLKIVRRPGLAEDIDEPAQLAGLSERGGAPYAFLRTALPMRGR
ncbi:MAG: 2-phospho-L-lactate guanylyltransferase [Steroidobacteraceae bacterium]